VEVDPALAQALEGGERRHAPVHGDPRWALARHAALEQQDAVLAGRQVQLGEQPVHARAVPEVQGGLDLAGGGPLSDDRLVRPLAREQAQGPDQDALAGPRLAGDDREAGLEVHRHRVQKGEVLDAQGLEHGGRPSS
jgi:hypothetical protein